MASKQYKTKAIVLKKIKLKEKDLIVSLLNEDGCLLQAVARGARKPGSSTAARLELFQNVELMLAKGRTLDTICDVRLQRQLQAHAYSIEATICASPLAELLLRIAQENLKQTRLYEMTQAAFASMNNKNSQTCLLLLAASLWKFMAQAGYRPYFDNCLICGNSRTHPCVKEHDNLKHSSYVQDIAKNSNFSLTEGGFVCHECAQSVDSVLVSSHTLSWCSFLLQARFNEIATIDAQNLVSIDAINLAKQWIYIHLGYEIKSLNFLLSSGLF